MARKANVLPSYLLHKQSGQARVRIDGKDHMLGLYGSEESRIAYGKLVANAAGGIGIDPLKSGSSSTNQNSSRAESGLTIKAGLIQTIQDLTGPACRWFKIDGEGGKLSIAGNRLIVRQSRKRHEQVMAVLEQLKMAADDAAEEQ